MDKVFRNVNLKGVISKERALKILGLEAYKETKIKGINIAIYVDDNYDIGIDILDNDGEMVGGYFDEI